MLVRYFYTTMVSQSSGASNDFISTSHYSFNAQRNKYKKGPSSVWTGKLHPELIQVNGTNPYNLELNGFMTTCQL